MPEVVRRLHPQRDAPIPRTPVVVDQPCGDPLEVTVHGINGVIVLGAIGQHQRIGTNGDTEVEEAIEVLDPLGIGLFIPPRI
jgi:hypothetical protein